MGVASVCTLSFCLTKLHHVPPPPPPPPPMHKATKVGLSYNNSCIIMSSAKARFGSSKGGAGVLERPTFDQSQFDPTTQVLEGGDIGQLRHKIRTERGDSYRVLLVDDVRHSEKLAAMVLPQVVPSVSPDDARKLFHESRENGVAVVIVTVKEHAEFYAQMMMRGGLRSTIEPDSNNI